MSFTKNAGPYLEIELQGRDCMVVQRHRPPVAAGPDERNALFLQGEVWQGEAQDFSCSGPGRVKEFHEGPFRGCSCPTDQTPHLVLVERARELGATLHPRTGCEWIEGKISVAPQPFAET